MTEFEKFAEKHLLKIAKDIGRLRDRILGVNAQLEGLQEEWNRFSLFTLPDLKQPESIKTAFTGPIMLSSNLNKVICTVPKQWRIMYIDWRDGSNTGWSTYTNVVVNRGGFFQWRFQNCPFALQINGNGELKCYSMDSGKEAFIKTVLWM